MRQKEQQYYQNIVGAMLGGSIGTPVVSPFHFACLQHMDVTLREKGRKEKVQIGVVEIRNGKIVKGLFFYDDY